MARGAGSERARRAAGRRSGEVEDVQLGCVTQIGEQVEHRADGADGRRLARVRVRHNGRSPVRLSMQTNFNAATAIWSGQLDLVVSAGVEMMSRVPMGSNGGDLSEKLLERWRSCRRPSARRSPRSVPARGSRCGLARVSPPRGRGQRRGPLRERDRAGRGAEPACGHALRGRRDTAPRHIRRGSGRAEACLSCPMARSLPGIRARSGGRRCRGADRKRAQGLRAWLKPARGSSRSGSPASIRTGCCTATRRLASAPSSARASTGTTSR